MNIGHFYFIKPEYFPHPEVMQSSYHRPCFFAFKEKGIMWLVPISSKVTKFERVYKDKIARYGKCDTIDFCNLLGHKKAVLIQNMFPAKEEHVLNEYLDDHENPVKLADKASKRIIHKAKKVLSLHRNGYGLIFGDVLELEKNLLYPPLQ